MAPPGAPTEAASSGRPRAGLVRQLAAAVPTTFHDDGTLDRDGQVALSASYADAGCSSLLVLDLTGGEPETLDAEERDRVVRAVRDGASGARIVVGIGTAEPAAVARAHRAARAGAEALVASVTGHQGSVATCTDIAELGLPLWLHHHPASGATGDLGSLLALAADLDVEAVLVETAPPADPIAEVVRAGRQAFGGLSGLFLPEELDAGATGTTAASAVPELLAPILAGVPEDGPMGLDTYLATLPYLRLEVGSAGTTVRKEAWRQRGVLASARMRRGRPLGPRTKVVIGRRLREVGIAVRDPYPGV